VPVSKYWLTLRRLVRMIAHAVEDLFDLLLPFFATRVSRFVIYQEWFLKSLVGGV
jgi:hypothetical protein